MHNLQEEVGPRFGEKPLKTMENLGLGPPISPLFWESLDPRPRSTLIGLRPKLGNTYYHIILCYLMFQFIWW